MGARAWNSWRGAAMLSSTPRTAEYRLGQVFAALLGGQPPGVQQPQGLAGSAGRSAGRGGGGGQEVVGDAPRDLLDLAAVGLGCQAHQPVGHRAGGHHDRVGEAGGFAQDLQLVAVHFGEQQVGAVDQGDPRVPGQGPQQRGGRAEGQVLQVQDLDGRWVDRRCQGLAQGGDVVAEGGAVQALAADREQVQPIGEGGPCSGRLEHERAGGDERGGAGVEVEEEFDAAAGAADGQVQEGRDLGCAHAAPPGISS